MNLYFVFVLCTFPGNSRSCPAKFVGKNLYEPCLVNLSYLLLGALILASQESKVEGINIPGYHGHCHFSLASPVLLISVNLPKHCLVVISKDFHMAVGLLSPDQFIDAEAKRQRAFVKHVKWIVSC